MRPYSDKAARGRGRVLICDVNLAEYYRKACEKLGREVAEARYYRVRESGIEVAPTGEEPTKEAGELKCKHGGRPSRRLPLPGPSLPRKGAPLDD